MSMRCPKGRASALEAVNPPRDRERLTVGMDNERRQKTSVNPCPWNGGRWPVERWPVERWPVGARQPVYGGHHLERETWSLRESSEIK